ncbi:MAG TPA: transglycosylase domain-containing protein, partial [Actinomycetota bacterium]|nr:transglycosylase domain-containing protein [Actinomycetota bacterium]
MQATPRTRVTSDRGQRVPPTPARPQPARVLPPLIPVLIVLTIVTISALVALVVLPLFTAAGSGVDAFRERLRAAGVGRVTIPRFPERSTIYAADGSVLATVFLDENRRIVQIENVAPIARDAIVAIEDHTFYEHGALDYRSLIRAALVNLRAGQIEQGGSTITQQLVKNAIIGDTSQTFARKFQEAALALRLERRYTKDEILELYINDAYFGNGAYGIGTAAETYFRKKPGELTLAEGALLAAVIRAPGTYDPIVHPEVATARRNFVIDTMVSLGMVTAEQGEKAKDRSLGLAKGAGAPKQRLEPFFVTYIRQLILDNENGEFDAFGATYKQRVHTLYQGGLRIHTTLDPDWQRYAQEAVLTRMDPNRGPDASLVSVDPRSGAIRAMLSGKNYRKDQYDLVWHGRRQVGSAFKPFTLVAAFENGFPPGTVYSSKSPNCSIPGWRSASGCVSNAEGASGGTYVDLWNATENSTNVVFAQLAVDVGPENIVEAAHAMGVQAPLDAVP